MKQQINIKCLTDISTDKIKVIKMLREAFQIGLKDAKDLADKFHQADTVVYESEEKLSIKTLNRQYTKDVDDTPFLKYFGGNFTNGFDREAFMEKIKFFASLALDNDESQIAEDLLHVYNKHIEE